MTGNESDNKEQSEFNSAITYLNRLNALFYQADESAITLNAYGWFHSLQAILRELSTELKDEELKKLNIKRKQIASNINSHLNDVNRGYTKDLSQELYDELHNFEIELRKIMKNSGLLLKMKDDAMKALR